MTTDMSRRFSSFAPSAIAAVLLAFATGGCGDSPPAATSGTGAGATKPTASATLSDSLSLATEPAGAKPIAEVIAGLTANTAAVVARGRIGEEGKSSYFTLADGSLKACTEMGDECPTPWDYCCTSAEDKKLNMATVELRVAGELVEASVLGFHGLDHLKEVVVTGEAKKDSAGNVTIVASGIWVKP